MGKEVTETRGRCTTMMNGRGWRQGREIEDAQNGKIWKGGTIGRRNTQILTETGGIHPIYTLFSTGTVQVLLHLFLVSTAITIEIIILMFFTVMDLNTLLLHCLHPLTPVLEVHRPLYTVLDLRGTTISLYPRLQFIRPIV